MLLYQQKILKARVGTIIGSLLLLSWSSGCALIIWQAAFDENPIANSFVKNIYAETQLEPYE